MRKVPLSGSFAAAWQPQTFEARDFSCRSTFHTWQTHRLGSRRSEGSLSAAGLSLLLKAARIHTAYLRRPL